jgi:hypothetical protein
LDELDARVGEGVGIHSLTNRLGLGAGTHIGNILDTEWGQNLLPDGDKTFFRMGTKSFMYSIYTALKMSLEKTIETYNKK